MHVGRTATYPVVPPDHAAVRFTASLHTAREIVSSDAIETTVVLVAAHHDAGSRAAPLLLPNRRPDELLPAVAR